MEIAIWFYPWLTSITLNYKKKYLHFTSFLNTFWTLPWHPGEHLFSCKLISYPFSLNWLFHIHFIGYKGNECYIQSVPRVGLVWDTWDVTAEFQISLNIYFLLGHNITYLNTLCSTSISLVFSKSFAERNTLQLTLAYGTRLKLIADEYTVITIISKCQFDSS